MNQIFKNYMKTFVKNWLQTIGTILFIMMMCAIVIGMLASPLQISSKIKSYEKQNIKFDSYIGNSANTKTNYGNDFLYKYVYENVDYKEYMNDEMVDLIDIDPSVGKILTSSMKSYIDQQISETHFDNDYEKTSFVGKILTSAFDEYSQGALIKTDYYINITDGNKKVNSSNISTLIMEMISFLQKDTEVMQHQYGYSQNEASAIAMSKIYYAYKQNNIELDLQSINPNGNIVTQLLSILNSGFNNLDGKVANKKFYLLSYQLFTPEFYSKMSDTKFSFNFKNYVTYNVINNVNNEKAFNFDNGTFNYKWYQEKSYYLTKTTTGSLFPTFALELKTINSEKDVNQIQMESGDKPNVNNVNNIIKGKETPSIVMASSYMQSNNMKNGDKIQIPESDSKNNLLQKTPFSAYFTDKIDFTVSGQGLKYDDVVPGTHYTPYLEDINTYAIGYISDELFDQLRISRWSFNSSNKNDFTTTIRIKNRNENVPNVEKAFIIDDKNSKTIFKEGSNEFLAANDSKTTKALNNLKIQVIVYIILGIVVLVLAFIFINFIIKKELNETRKQIGIFKSFGYKISELSWIFALKTFITILGGMLIGYIVSIPLQLYSASNYTSSIMFDFQHIYANPGFIIVIILLIPIIFLGVSYGLTLLYLKEPTLSLLSNGAKISKIAIKPSLLIRYLAKQGKAFNYRLQRSFVRTSIGKFIVVQILFAIASLTFTLMFGAQTLMYSMVNQGFSIMKESVNHEFNWKNANELNMAVEDTKYSIKNIDDYQSRNFDYIAYSNENDISNVIQENKDTSDARYRVSFLIDSIANEFDSKHESGIDMLMPKDFYYNKYSANPITDVPMLQGDNAQKIIEDNYYLNWILTFKISDLTNDIVNGVKENHKYYFDDIKEFIVNHPDSKLDISKALSGDENAIKELEKEFINTAFGMSDLDKNGLKNNLFLSDVTKIISLQLMESYLDGKVTTWLTNNAKSDSNGKYKDEDINKALEFAQDTDVAKEFTPNNSKYWGIKDNPLIDISSMMGGNDSNSSESSNSNGGLSLSKLSPQTVSLIMSAMMLGLNEEDINKMPVITMNELFYNKDTEMLAYELPVLGNEENFSDNVYLKMFDASANEYGDFNNLFNHDGVSNEAYKSLSDDLPEDDMINGVIPYGLAKTYNKKVGDILELKTNTIKKQNIRIKIVGINKNVSFTLGLSWPIDVDYNVFRSKFFDDNLNVMIDAGLPIFNKLYSEEDMLVGKINLNDIAESINSMKYVGKNLSMSIESGASIFGSIFNGMIDFTKVFNLKIDPSVNLVTNPNVASTSKNSSVVPYNIFRVGVNDAVDRVNNILVLFMILEAVLLLIILVVVMNIVVEEASQVILTLRSLGYRNRDINWIVMGSYIIGAIISFVVAYALSLIIWAVFLNVAGELWHIYVFMSFSWKAPIITFLVIFGILFIGWFTSNWKVNKTPLTMVTSFG